MKRSWSLSWPRKAKAEPTTSVDETSKDKAEPITSPETTALEQPETTLQSEKGTKDQTLESVAAPSDSSKEKAEIVATQEVVKEGATDSVITTPDPKITQSTTTPTAMQAQDEITAINVEPKKHNAATTESYQAIQPMTPTETKPKQLPIKKLKEYPESDRKLSLPDATKEGQIQVAAGRGKPFWLSYKAYGSGPIHIVWLCGHGDSIKSWRRMVTHFGHGSSDKYTSLLVDSRGTGDSEGPFGWWSMKDMATDVVELLNKLDWTAEKSLHFVGHSMGGMCSQEIALAIPQRIASLTLVSTTSDWLADLSVWSGIKTLGSMLAPKFEDQRLDDTKAQFFGTSWILEADETGVFPTNGDNWAATSYLEQDRSYRGAALQATACVGHSIKPEDLKSLAKTIGHQNIQIIHGHSDKIAPFAAAQKLYDIFGGHLNSGVKLHVFEDTGHMPQIERYAQVVKLIEDITKSDTTS